MSDDPPPEYSESENHPLLVSSTTAVTTTTTVLDVALDHGETAPHSFSRDMLAWSSLQASFNPYWVAAAPLLVMLATDQAKNMLIAKSGFKYINGQNHACIKGSHGCFKAPNIPILFATLNYESFINVCSILSIVVFIIFSLFFSVVGDFGYGRRKATILCCVAGSLLLFIPLIFETSNSFYWLGGLIFLASQVIFSFGAIFSNAYLAVMVRKNVEHLGSESRLLANQVSSRADMASQALATVVQLICAGVLTQYHDHQPFAARLCLAIIGGILLIQSLVSMIYLSPYPGPVKPANKSYVRLSIDAWVHTWSLRHRLPHFFRFMLSMALLQDAVSTVSLGLSVIAIGEVGMGITENTYAMCCFTVGSLVADVIAYFLVKYRVISDKSVIMAANFLIMFIPFYTLLALTSKMEVYVVSFVVGMLQTSVWVYGISINTQLMPARKESQLFAISQITSNGSSWLAPFVIVAVQQLTPSYRIAFTSITIFFVTGLISLYFTDVHQGLEDAGLYKDEVDDKEA